MMPLDGCVPGLVGAAARAAPQRPALVADSASLTYGELDARANAVAACLRALGVARDVVVGVCMDRSPAAVVGALGIMKAGGAYLPLDPSHPAERLAFQIADARAAIVLATDERARVSERLGCRLVRLAADGTPAETATADAAAEIAPHDLAYVVYTSGSTGRPKGVEIAHAALANLVRWHVAAFGVGAADRASHLSAVAFDAAVWELWPYLAAGASIHVAADAVAKEPQALRDWFVGHGITIGFTPSPLTEQLMRLAWPADGSLRIMLTGADRLHAHPPPALPFRVVNNYGPSECCVVSTSSTVPPLERAGGLPPIGRPISGSSVEVCDESGRPAALGDEGELWIGGLGLARGYRNRPELTAAAFVPGPDGARRYRTGDRGRVLPDGQIAFLGRIDEQIAIRGLRVEPGEIEAALDEHPAVRDSAVVARDAAAGDTRLVAYLVLRAGEAPASDELQRFLAARVPRDMIPSAYVALPALPLSDNGKVDRAALRAREADAGLRPSAYAAPTSPLEARLAQIVAALLRLERVGTEDDFFLLGGHSLLGTQLIARISDAFGVKMGLRPLFQAPTVRGLAAEVARLLLLRGERDDGARHRTT